MNVSRSSKKFAHYADALEYRRQMRLQGYKTGRIFSTWQGLFAFMFTR